MKVARGVQGYSEKATRPGWELRDVGMAGSIEVTMAQRTGAEEFRNV